MNVGMPQYGMPSGASSGAPYFNGWSPSGGFAQPQQGYGMSSPFGGYGMSSPFGGFGGGYWMPFQQMPMGGGKGGYSSPFGQFQTPNFAAKGGQTQLQSPISPTGVNPPPGTASPQPNAPIPQAVPPQMMSPVSGPTQMLPQQMFNQTRIPGANSVLPGRNMLIGGYR